MELTKYELARIVGARALQLSAGAPPMIKAEEGASFLTVAQIELSKNVLPLIVLKERAR
ncbi:MAG: DNA-directed RNA polymerase subunit K [Candidatus Micrarchaeia archaeon]|jgi:DNA-directed RNA polymerase subunit K/omega